ncbi:MAG: Flp pilus assembly complex ATPase component TadA [Lachnospiraceae bacterium]|nr:Flp pilus assembly complex ATPase component TadA [Lachnospiraceae bacterium]
MLDELVSRIRQCVLERMDLSRDLSDEEIGNLIGEETGRLTKEISLSLHERLQLEKRVFNSLRRLDALQELLDDPQVSEVMVNGPSHIFYEKAGEVFRWDQGFASEEKMQDVIQQIVGRHNRVVNLSNPIVDTRLEDGSRVNIVLSPISIDGSAITIRKFPEKPLDMNALMEKKAIHEEAVRLLECLVRARYSILISGGTSSGKTTFLNALSQYIPVNERVITIEDSAELQIQGVSNLVRLETRNANMEGVLPVTIRDLIKTALRMRPDRIIIGECRGAEAFDMLQALNTGHDGGLTTAHGNSAKDILARLEMMVLMGMELPLAAIRKQIDSGIDLIVHLGRLSDRSRRVLEITELCGIRDGEIVLSPLYQLQGEEGSWQLIQTGVLKNRKKLEMAGIELPQSQR